MTNSFKRIAAWMLAFTLAFALSACGSNGPQAAADETNAGLEQGQAQGQERTDGKTESGQADLKTQYPLTVKDATGHEFTFDKAPEKIVSVSPAETESLFALGLDEQIVGVSDYDDYPEAALSKPKMGGITKPNEESLIAAQADIVFTGISMKADTVEKLRSLGINIFKVEPKTLDDVIANIELYGQITDRQEQAKQVTDRMKADRDRVVEAVKDLKPEEKKKVYVEFSPGYTVGKGEFMDELITISGGVNVASDITGWSKISEENIIQADPDVILYAKELVDFDTKKPLEEIIRGRSGWDKITAIKENRVVGLDDNTLSRPGPRLTEGLLEMAKGIYPDLVK